MSIYPCFQRWFHTISFSKHFSSSREDYSHDSRYRRNRIGRFTYTLELTRKGKMPDLLRKESSTALVEKLFTPTSWIIEKCRMGGRDVTDVYSVFESLEGVEEVYHAAAMISFAFRSEADDEGKYRRHCQHGEHVARERSEKFCHISSVAAWAEPLKDSRSMRNRSENVSLNSNYAISKYGAEREVWRGIEEGWTLLCSIQQLSSVRATGTKEARRWFSRFGKDCDFIHPGSTGFVDVRDVAKAAVLLMEKTFHAQRYILNAENVSIDIFWDHRFQFTQTTAFHRVSPFLGEVAWESIALACVLQNKPLITKETSRNAQRHWTYSNEKIIVKPACVLFLCRNLAHTCEVFLRNKGERRTNLHFSISAECWRKLIILVKLKQLISTIEVDLFYCDRYFNKMEICYHNADSNRLFEYYFPVNCFYHCSRLQYKFLCFVFYC